MLSESDPSRDALEKRVWNDFSMIFESCASRPNLDFDATLSRIRCFFRSSCLLRANLGIFASTIDFVMIFADLGTSWEACGSFWEPLTPSWRAVGGLLGPLESLLVPLGSLLGLLGEARAPKNSPRAPQITKKTNKIVIKAHAAQIAKQIFGEYIRITYQIGGTDQGNRPK